MAVREPRPATLRKYGISLDEWRKMLEAQEGTCYVCRRIPPSGRLCIDHYHARRWVDMPDEERKKYVRGLLCDYCNRRLVAKGMTTAKAERIHKYLSAFDARRPIKPSSQPF